MVATPRPVADADARVYARAMDRRRHRWRGTLAAVVGFALAACRPTPEPPPRRDAPTTPLRDEAIRGPIPADARVTDWVIDVTLDAEAHRIDATARLRWTNRGPNPVAVLPMHQYLSGYRAADTAWMRDGLHAGRTAGIDPDHAWGWVDVTDIVRHRGGGDGDADAVQEVSWAERDEPSLLDVQLGEAVAPGQTVDLELTFSTHLPKVFARTGFAGPFHMVGQWLPKPCVQHEDGTFADDPFTFHSEFFSDFGHWKVTLDVPATYVIGATGVRVDGSVTGDRRVETYEADMVHHFAWAAGPDLVVWDGEHEGIQIRQLLPPDAVADAPMHHDAVVAALDSMQARFGPYPWTTVTVIHPPPGAGPAGGMEYPTLFTTNRRRRLPPLLEALGFVDRFSGAFVTIHEFGHQYFQGILASNEFAQPWLDEGMNSLSNTLVYLDRYADEPEPWIVRLAGQPFHILDGVRVQQRFAGDLEAVDQSAAGFDPSVGGYGATVYRKTTAIMLTLRALVGAEAFDAALKAYAMKWRFRHPTGHDLIDALAEGIGEQVDVSEPGADGSVVRLSVRDYLTQTLGRADHLDYAVRRAGQRPGPSQAGHHRAEDGSLRDDGPPQLEPSEAFTVIERHGGLSVPVQIEATFDDGTTERVTWDGVARHVTLHWPDRTLRRVTIDPDGRLFLETRRINNTRYADGVDPNTSLGDVAGNLAQAIALGVLAGVGP